VAESVAPVPEAHAASGHGAEADADPMEHASDYALFGVDAKSRSVSWGTTAGYGPMKVGPFKLEFTRHMLDLTVVAVLLGAVLVAVARRVLHDAHTDRAPHGRLANGVEAALCFVRDEIVAPVGGVHLAPYAPLFVTYFLFILLANLTGMVPVLSKGPTANLAVTGALAITVVALVFGVGMVKQGPVRFFINLVPSGMPRWLWPMMFILEVFGLLVRCAVLGVRLFANMLAGHLILPSTLGLAVFKPGATGMAVLGLVLGVPIALGVSLLEVLVCLIQAYVFTMLAVIFTSAAVHPEH